MRMGFDVHPDDAPRLPRSPLCARKAGTRSRYRAERIVWHDGGAAELRRAGLALAEERGVWRLTRLAPDGGGWLATQPAPELAQALLPADLGHELPADLSPVAAFEGRSAAWETHTEAGPITLILLRGTVGDTALAWLTLDGPDHAVRAMAVALAGAFRVTVPRASPSAASIWAAAGAAPPPRHFGGRALFDGADVVGIFAHAMGHCTDVLLHYAPLAAAGGADTEPVHQMRVAVRRARSAVAAFRIGLACPDVLAADRELKELGRVLGPVRDWDVFVTEPLSRVAAAFPGEARLARLGRAAQRQRETLQAALRSVLLAPAFQQQMVGLAWLCASRSWQATLGAAETAASALPPEAFASHVLQRRWKKVTAAGKEIESLDVVSLHGLRLRAKRARYAMEIFQPRAHPKPAQRMIRRLSALQHHLGLLNDGAVAEQLLGSLEDKNGRHAYAIGLVLGFLAAAAESVRPDILRAWMKFRRTPRFWS